MAVYDILDGNEANPRIILFETFGAAVQALISGDVDLVLMDAASSRGYIGANPEKLKLIGEPLGTEEFGFIFTPGSDLVEPFNVAIGSMQKDGFLERLNTKWFFEYMPPNKSLSRKGAPAAKTGSLEKRKGRHNLPFSLKELICRAGLI